MGRVCTLEGCGRKHDAHGLCHNHYKQLQRRNNKGSESSATRKAYLMKWGRSSSGRWTMLKRAVRVSGIPSDITREQHEELTSHPCEYCGEPLNPTGHGLDKKDPKQGYILANVVPCCYTCNKMKNAFLTYEEMKFVMKQLSEFRRQGGNISKGGSCGS